MEPYDSMGSIFRLLRDSLRTDNDNQQSRASLTLASVRVGGVMTNEFGTPSNFGTETRSFHFELVPNLFCLMGLCLCQFVSVFYFFRFRKRKMPFFYFSIIYCIASLIMESIRDFYFPFPNWSESHVRLAAVLVFVLYPLRLSLLIRFFSSVIVRIIDCHIE